MPYSINSPEFKLGICCTAINFNLSHQIINRIKESLDWNENYFIDFLQKHRIEELAFITLKDQEFFSVPFKQRIESSLRQNQLKALSAFRIQSQLQIFFNENQVQSIFLKGIFLSKLYYGDIGLRNVFDIDVWVEEKNIDLTADFLRTIGYRKINEQQKYSRHQLKYLKLSSHHDIFINPFDENAVPIELHWKIRNSLGNYMFNPVLERKSLFQIDVNELEFTVLNHIDQFIFIAVHGAEHGWFRMKWLADLYHIQKTIDFDWDTLFDRAINLRSYREVKMACHLLSQFYTLDEDTFNGLSGLNFLDKLRINYVKNFMLYPYGYCDTRFEKIKNGIYLLSLNRRGYIAKELIYKNLTKPIDWVTLPLPDYLFFLYFPLRPFLWLYRKIKSKLF